MLSVPDMPSEVVVTSTTATTISFSWTAPSGSLGTYKLEWERDASGKCTIQHNGSVIVTDGSTNYNLAGLEEDSNYIIIILVVSSTTQSLVIGSTRGMTKEAGEGVSEKSVIKIISTCSPD